MYCHNFKIGVGQLGPENEQAQLLQKVVRPATFVRNKKVIITAIYTKYFPSNFIYLKRMYVNGGRR